jgi:hypothetical protein
MWNRLFFLSIAATTLSVELRAQPTIRITSPASDLVVHPGDTVTVQAVVTGPYSLVGVTDPSARIAEPSVFLKSPPYLFRLTIPTSAVPSRAVIRTALYDPDKADPIASDSISFDVERADSPREIRVTGPRTDLQVGSDSGVGVIGIFDGDQEVPLSESLRTIYEVIPAGIVSVNNGRVAALTPGKAQIVVPYEKLVAAVDVSVSSDRLHIMSPVDGAVVYSGETMSVDVAPSGRHFTSVAAIISEIGFKEIDAAPYHFNFEIPKLTKLGTRLVSCLGETSAGSVSSEILVDVERRDGPQEMKVDVSQLELEPGSQASLNIYGVYADGSVVDLNESSETRYEVAPGVVVVSPGGLVTALAPGSATIVVTHRERRAVVTAVVTDDRQ